MYEYKFVECPVKYERGQAIAEPLRELVEAHSREGWRLVQVIVLNPAAIPSYHHVIFERTRTDTASVVVDR